MGPVAFFAACKGSPLFTVSTTVCFAVEFPVCAIKYTFIRSNGAVAVRDIAPATPPAIKYPIRSYSACGYRIVVRKKGERRRGSMHRGERGNDETDLPKPLRLISALKFTSPSGLTLTEER